MYGEMKFYPPIRKKKMTSMEVDVIWNAFEFHPTQNQTKKGGVYVAYTMGVKNGPGGYFGVQIKSSGGINKPYINICNRDYSKVIAKYLYN